MNILVIAPHPDDETLGCGGTLLRHLKERDTCNWLIVTEGYPPNWSDEVLERKRKEIDAVGQAYSMNSITKLGFKTTQLQSVPLTQIMDGVAGALEKTKPQVVYLPHFGDVHTDHQVLFNATMSVLKSFHMRKWGVNRILSFETLSSTEAAPQQPHRSFFPNVFRDISTFLPRKLEIMALYKSEAQSTLMPRGASAITAQARLRGASIGVEHAEAFMLVRECY